MADCIHSLPVTACADCNRRLLPPREYGPWFAARFRGDCIGCEAEVNPGDLIRSDGYGGWLCGICGDRGGGLQEIKPSGKYL